MTESNRTPLMESNNTRVHYISVIQGNRPHRSDASSQERVRKSNDSNIITLPRTKSDRNTTISDYIKFGLLNVRSLNKKVDDILELQRDHTIGIMCLTETWHDPNSVCVGRLRGAGFTVIEKARPRTRKDSIKTNHGGVMIASAPGLRLSEVNLGATPSSFEFVCARVIRKVSVLVLVIYRPGSASVTQHFLDEMGDLLDRASTHNEAVLVTGDLNVRLDRPEEPFSQNLHQLFQSYGLSNHVTCATHREGGWLDVVASRQANSDVCVEVTNTGFSDHYLLTWGTPFSRPPPVYKNITIRTWGSADGAALKSKIVNSPLCQPSFWQDLDVDDLADMYANELTRIADEVAPVKTVRVMDRPSDVWFDDDCREAKIQLRKLERTLKKTSKYSSEWSMLNENIISHRKYYRRLRRSRQREYWRDKISNESDTPSKMWKSVEIIMGKGKVITSDSVEVTADKFLDFFQSKVHTIRQATKTAPSPYYSIADPDCELQYFEAVSLEQVTSAVLSLPNKQCCSDPIPTKLLKELINSLAPFLTLLFNRSLITGVVPRSFISAYVTLLLKRSQTSTPQTSGYIDRSQTSPFFPSYWNVWKGSNRWCGTKSRIPYAEKKLFYIFEE